MKFLAVLRFSTFFCPVFRFLMCPYAPLLDRTRRILALSLSLGIFFFNYGRFEMKGLFYFLWIRKFANHARPYGTSWEPRLVLVPSLSLSSSIVVNHHSHNNNHHLYLYTYLQKRTFDLLLSNVFRIIFWPAARVGKVNQILRCDWPPEWAIWSYLAQYLLLY